MRRLTLLAFGALGFACAEPPPPSSPATAPVDSSTATPAAETRAVVEIGEAFETARSIEDNVDSVAFWKSPAGDAWILATAKSTHRLLVYNAETGELVRRVGEEGDGTGQLRRPNGIAVAADSVVVVERDTHRVQLWSLPDFEPLGFFGDDVLQRPYGLTVLPAVDLADAGWWELFVTDNYETAAGEIPPMAELGERVKHFRFSVADGALESELVASFGATEGDGVLHKVETIAADPAIGHLLIADEERLEFEIYDFAGSYTGRKLGGGLFAVEPEGLALWECGSEGYWLATDQFDERSRFLVFDRTSLEHLGTFSGEVTANTDGATLTRIPTSTFPAGAFYAVHDDQSVTAFDWRNIAAALGLETEC